ncbi:beta-galactosidase [Eisenbergiella sp.]
MENTIIITGQYQERKAVLLPMGGKDSAGNRFEVDNISFLKNGRRFIPIMGEFHFSRYEPEAWEEELLKMRAGGVEIVATYVFWIHHEEAEGEWDFTGCRNLREFLQICRNIGMPVWLRIGPWAHGECRNGGFPDWLIKDEMPVRINNPVYLKRVERFWKQLGEQAEGMMCKDGGPILGVQLENEYGHCGGPSDRNEGMAHMLTLKKIAQAAGFIVPYYTATGWGGAYVPDGEALPVLGGYVDAPWADHVQEMPANTNFIFSSYKMDDTIGSDFDKNGENNFTFNIHKSPYLTAELGGGLQVTSHRRTYPWPEDIQAQALCMLGSGANLLGYYMYHGGINPDGKYSTLQESRATGYNNDLPVKSYDFQTCIRESGEINTSFGALKKLHLFISSFGEILAGADTYFAQQQLESAEDCHTLRMAARINHSSGTGFLFVNNHQRKRRMDEHREASVRIVWEGGEKILEHIRIKSGECAVFPFRMPGYPGMEDEKELPPASLLPDWTNASLLCRLGNRVFYWSDMERPYFETEKAAADYVILSKAQADRAFLSGGHLYITERADSCLIEEKGQQFLLTKAESETIVIYSETGAPKQVKLETSVVNVPAKAELYREEQDVDGTVAFREYKIQIKQLSENNVHQLYLEADYDGDRAEVYIDGKLTDDWFTTGEKWHVALKRFRYPEELTIRIYPSSKPIPNPYDNKVYYDLPVKEGCELHKVKVLPEYKIMV